MTDQLPKNLSIEPVTQFDVGDLGSLSNYRTNQTLNRIENRVLKDMQARNKQMVDAIKQDPTSLNSLMLTLGRGMSEQRTNRELADLRGQVRGSDIQRARAKQEKAVYDKNVREVNNIIKDIAPDLRSRLDPKTIVTNFTDPRTGGINYQSLGKYLEDENARFQKSRPQTPKMRQAILKQIATNQKLIDDNPENENLIAEIRLINDGLMEKLGGTGADISFTPGHGDYVETGTWFDGQKGNYKTNIKLNVNGQETLIPLKEDDRPKLSGNRLTYTDDQMNVKTIVLNKKQLEAYKDALAKADKVHSISYDKAQGEGFNPYEGLEYKQVQTGDPKRSLTGVESAEAGTTGEGVSASDLFDNQLNEDLKKMSNKDRAVQTLIANRKKQNNVKGVSSEMPTWKEDLTGDPAFPAQRPMTREDSARNSANYLENIGQNPQVAKITKDLEKSLTGVESAEAGTKPRKIHSDNYNTKLAKELEELNPLTMPKPTRRGKEDRETLANEGAFSAWVWHEDEGGWFKHGSSIDPRTGEVLKKPGHPTWDLMVQAEQELGNKIIERDGKFYSVKLDGSPSTGPGSQEEKDIPYTNPKKRGYIEDLDITKMFSSGQPEIDATLDQEPRSTYTRADAEAQQKQERFDATGIEEENLARIKKQMARVNQTDPEPSLLDKVRNIGNAAYDKIDGFMDYKGLTGISGNELLEGGPDIAEAPETPSKELDDVQKQNIKRTALQNVRGESNDGEPSMLGKVSSYLGDEFTKEGQRVSKGIDSAQDAIINQAKEFMAHEGVTGISGNEAVQWATENWSKFNDWRKGVYGPDKAEGAISSAKIEKIQSDKMKSGIDKPYLQSATDRNAKGVFKKVIIPEGTPYADNFQRGITLAGRNGKAKDVRPGFMVALAGTENAKFDPKALGIEKDKKTGQNVPGGKIQGLGMVQMTVDTAKGTDLGKMRFKGKSDQEISKMLKNDPDLNIAISTQFVQKLFNVFKKNEYTKKFKPFEMEMLVGIAYNNKGESFRNVVNRIKPKNLKDLLNKVKLEEQTNTHIPRLRRNLNKQRRDPQYVSGGNKPKSMWQKVKDADYTNKQFN